MKKLAIIPAYNESAGIEKTLEDIRTNAPDFDYVVINDCSTDATADILRENGRNFIDLPINLGIGGAVQTGYLYALRNGYEIAVQFDGDGQHSARYLGQMAEILVQEKYDMVIGSRFIENQGFQSSAMRRVGIRFFTHLIHLLTGQTITDPTSGMRMVNLDVIRRFAKDYPRDYPEPESTAYLLSRGCRVKEVPVCMNERNGGVSSISPRKSIYYMVKVTMAILIARFRR